MLVGGAAVALPAPAVAGTYLGPVKMQRACTQQHPGMGLTAVLLDRRDAYTWRCASPDGYLGHVDVDRYCRTRHGDDARSGLRDMRKPRSWYCQR